MTKRILTIILLLFSLTFSLKAEDDSNNNEQPPKQGIKKKLDPKDPGLAKAPSRVMILFTYNNAAETVYFNLPADVEYIDILLHNSENGFTFAGYASAFDPEWHQPLAQGEYYIECTADNGDIYAGYIYI